MASYAIAGNINFILEKYMFYQAISLTSILFAALIATIIVFMYQLSFYKKQIINKDLNMITSYLDKTLLYKILNRNYNKYTTLEEVKAHFQLADARILTIKELENDKNLGELFKDKLNSTIDKFMKESKENTVENKVITTRYENQVIHKLYAFLDKSKIEDENYEMLIYTKIPYVMTESERESLNLFIHLTHIR